jgi:hypothetical protein
MESNDKYSAVVHIIIEHFDKNSSNYHLSFLFKCFNLYEQPTRYYNKLIIQISHLSEYNSSHNKSQLPQRPSGITSKLRAVAMFVTINAQFDFTQND